MRTHLKFLPFVATALMLTACGTTTTERVATGALGGAVLGGVIGGNATGAVIGGAAGAAAGAIVDSNARHR